MNEFIEEFGKENFIIIIAVVGAIILALIIIVLIEKLQAKRKLKKQLKKELSNYNEVVKKEKEVSNNVEIKQEKVFETVEKEYEDEEIFEEKIEEPIEYEDNNYEDVVYVEEVNTEKKAKEKLEEVTKRLIEEEMQKDLIEHTNFEVEQEEKSIISYDELIKASHDIDEKNDSLLEDEGEEPITLEELYQKHVDTQNVIEEPKPEVKVNNPVFEEKEEKKFKNSEVISPVFGFYSGEVKQDKENKSPKEVFKELDKEVGMKDLEAEIEKTEEFLSELKRLKNKLD